MKYSSMEKLGCFKGSESLTGKNEALKEPRKDAAFRGRLLVEYLTGKGEGPCRDSSQI